MGIFDRASKQDGHPVIPLATAIRALWQAIDAQSARLDALEKRLDASSQQAQPPRVTDRD